MEQNKRLMKIAIAGMGLIGGSLGLALKKRTEHTVIGIDIDPTVVQAALDGGAADKVGAEHLAEADLLVLALPPTVAVEFLTAHADKLKKGAVVTDVCGVKRYIVQKCRPICLKYRLDFVGGHPMAGKEHSGFSNATPDLFEDAYYIFTPTEDTPETVLDMLKKLAYDIGCSGVTIATPEQHDRIIAFTSQLPHVLAGAYVKSPVCAQNKGFSAGSYRDVSRVATVDERLWSQLFLMNADNLCNEIDELISNLKVCREAVANGEPGRLTEVLREGRVKKECVNE
ncbi:MAG: prephenate dehydrogenase/arogenate dehydrogenase family protein [Oscillospiraceae bacterium]|nr:prephenate dehydrogenase/arogenate dehydrogenase family protein [Oscillospiraceae bacterium]MDD4413115.1 prephenate dehydrogenase/arogenate dehydrogenase family protein [Oscillospiraceae bacterium]